MPICLNCVNWAPTPKDYLSRAGFAPCTALTTPHTGYAATYPRICPSFKQAPDEKVQRRREIFGIATV